MGGSMGHRTVVAWDGSAPADHAVGWAVRRAHHHDGHLLVVRVVDDAHMYIDALEVERGLALANFRVAELAARLRREHPGLEVDTLVTAGMPLDVLAAVSDEETLLVVGSEHGMGDDYWYGSRMGRRLAAITTGPVAIIPIADDRPRTGVIAAIPDPHSAAPIVFLAADVAEQHDEPLILVHALEGESGEMVDDDRGADSATILDELVDSLASERPGLEVVCQVTAESPVHAILRPARDASHVVVGTRRPGMLRRLFLGSVSHTVVDNARCPVIVVSPDLVGTRRRGN